MNTKLEDISKDATLYVHASHSKTGESRKISLSDHAKNILSDWTGSKLFEDTHTCSEDVDAALAEMHGEEHKPKKRTKKLPTNKDQYLFWNVRTEAPIKDLSGSYRRLVDTYKHEYRFRDHTLYTLRHTFASEAIGQVNIDTVRELLGHKDIRTTQIYLTQDTEKLEEATKEISKAFSFSAPKKQKKPKGTKRAKSKHKKQSYAAQQELKRMKKKKAAKQS